MDFRETIISQYHAALEMLKQSILTCPETLWHRPDDSAGHQFPDQVGEPGIKMKSIDFHIHPPGPGGLSTEEQAQMAAYFRGDPPPASTEQMADYYQRIDMFGVLFAIDNETVSGRPPVPNQYFADLGLYSLQTAHGRLHQSLTG